MTQWFFVYCRGSSVCRCRLCHKCSLHYIITVHQHVLTSTSSPFGFFPDILCLSFIIVIVAALAAASDPFLQCWFWTAHFETQHVKTSWAHVMGKKKTLIWLPSIQPPFDPQIDSWPNLVLNLKEKRNHEDLHALTSFLIVENNLRSGGGSWVTKREATVISFFVSLSWNLFILMFTQPLSWSCKISFV